MINLVGARRKTWALHFRYGEYNIYICTQKKEAVEDVFCEEASIFLVHGADYSLAIFFLLMNPGKLRFEGGAVEFMSVDEGRSEPLLLLLPPSVGALRECESERLSECRRRACPCGAVSLVCGRARPPSPTQPSPAQTPSGPARHGPALLHTLFLQLSLSATRFLCRREKEGRRRRRKEGVRAGQEEEEARSPGATEDQGSGAAATTTRLSAPVARGPERTDPAPDRTDCTARTDPTHTDPAARILQAAVGGLS